MLYNTQAIALHYIKYADNALVLNAYTQQHGQKTYFVRLNKRQHIGLFKPFSILNLSVYSKENNNLQNIKDAELALPLLGINTDILKSTLAIFCAEAFAKAIVHPETDEELYNFLYDTVTYLDSTTDNLSLFPQYYLLSLSQILGFAPQQPPTPLPPFFDLQNGHFSPHIPPHPHYLEGAETAAMAQLIANQGQTSVAIPKPLRIALLNRLIEFFMLHIAGFKAPKAQSVLQDVFY